MKRPALQFCEAGCLRRSEPARVETANDKDGCSIERYGDVDQHDWRVNVAVLPRKTDQAAMLPRKLITGLSNFLRQIRK